MADSSPHAALSPELFAQIKAIELRARRLTTDMLSGNYVSAFKGRGMRFEQVREYQPGDDVRHIDWNVTARMRAPFVKEFREERELTVMLLVDVSSSGAFGSQDKFKNETAAEVAAILAYAAIKSHDRVGVIIFSDRIEHVVAPKSGRAHVWRVIRDILASRTERRGTSIAAGLGYLHKVLKRRAVVFVVSDFLDDAYADALGIAARRHDLTAISVTDPRELSLPKLGILHLQDCETGEQLWVDTCDQAVRNNFAQRASARLQARDALLSSLAVPQIQITCGEPHIETLVQFFRSHKRHLSR